MPILAAADLIFASCAMQKDPSGLVSFSVLLHHRTLVTLKLCCPEGEQSMGS